MKILHIDPDDIDNPLSGGGPVRTFEIYRRMSKRHEITVLTPTFEGSSPELFRDGVHYIRLGKKIRNHGSSHHITFFFSLPKAIRTMEYDLLVEDFMPPMSTTFNPLLAKSPVIGSVQWFFAEALSKQYKLPFFLGERYGVRLYKNLVVLSEQMKKLLSQRNPGANIAVIPNGVEPSLFSENPRVGNYILFLGRIDIEQKGVDLLLKAYSKIPESLRIPLYLAGHSFQMATINKLIDDYHLCQWVFLPGKVFGKEKKRLFDGCRFVCVPSREETFGMVITEACAAGKPVVCFDKEPMNTVSSPKCLRVKPFDIDAYSQSMQTLLNVSEKKLFSYSKTCVEWAQQFQWDEISRQQECFYESVLEEA